MFCCALGILLLLIALPASAQSYLVEPTLAAAQTRSQQQCTILACDGVKTIYWWYVQPLTNGTAAIQINTSGLYGVTTTIKSSTAGLSPAEILALVSAASIAPLLPVVVVAP